MSWAEVKKINSDLNVPINDIIGETYYSGEKVKSIRHNIKMEPLYLPEDFQTPYPGSAVVYNDKIVFTCGKGKLQFDGTSWSTFTNRCINNVVSSSGTISNNGDLCVFNGKLYQFMTDSSSPYNGYFARYDSDLDCWVWMGSIGGHLTIQSMQQNGAILYRDPTYNTDMIYVFAGSGGTTAQAWNGTSWYSRNSTTGHGINQSGIAVYQGKLHIFGGNASNSVHSWYDGTWHSEGLSFNCSSSASCCVYNDKVHFICGNTNHYTYDGTNFELIESLPFNIINAPTVVYHNKIHIMGAVNGGQIKNCHITWDGKKWEVFKIPTITTTYELETETILP